MAYFTTRKVFLAPSFDLDAKEEEKMLRFLQLLEKSNVGPIIEKSVRNNRGRGIKSVSTEAMLELAGLNISKLFKFYETKTYPTFWVAPDDLIPQSFKKPSAKRSSAKGSKINAKIYKK